MDRDRACDFYAEHSERRVKKFNEKLPEKHIAKGDLVMKYESAPFKPSFARSGQVRMR